MSPEIIKINKIFSSYKDPSGFVFCYDDKIYRQINSCYKDNYELFIQSGLYQRLIDQEALVSHQEVLLPNVSPEAYKIIEPELIPFISYPYEWCFSQLKDAALLTLRIEKEAINLGLSLKDASSFNIQFFKGKPIFIDTLSFEKYKEGTPWVAYKQFCEHFLAPLALMAYTDCRLGKLMQINIDGVPLDLASKLLPFRAKLKPTLFFHIFLHAGSQKHFSNFSRPAAELKFKKNALLGLLENLESGIKNLKWTGDKTVWTSYYQEENCGSYEPAALMAKKNLVASYLDKAKTKKLWDIGANTGLFSRLAAQKGIEVISLDCDQSVVELNYSQVKTRREKDILPLLLDITNPSPALGWYNQERTTLFSRPLPDTILALALLHHLVISKNIPFIKIAHFFADICNFLIIEFVPKNDKQVRLLLQNREDIFTDYQEERFESEFSQYFEIKEKNHLPNSERLLYLLVKRQV